MTEDFFRVQIKRLIQTYGEKAYPQARVELLWEKVKVFNQADFGKFVSDSIMDCKFAPVGSEFNEFAQEQYKKIELINKEERLAKIARGEICDRCGNEGLSFAIKQSDESRWAFGCIHCDTIKKNPRILNYGDKENTKQVKLWDDKFYPEFILQKLSIWTNADAAKREQRHGK